MARPKTRTARLVIATVLEIKRRFGTIKNAYAALQVSLAPMTQDVFSRVAAGRASLPQEVKSVQDVFIAWKRENLKKES